MSFKSKSSLSFLLSGVGGLKGVGEYFEKCLKSLAGSRIFDLLLVWPHRAQRILFCPKLYEVGEGALVVLKLKVESHQRPHNRRQPHKFICSNPSGMVNLVFFKVYPGQIEKLKEGSKVAVLGVLKKGGGGFEIVHPDFVVDVKKIDELPKVDFTYPLSGNLTQKFVRGKIKEIFRVLDEGYDEKKARDNDWVDKELLKKMGWPFFLEALRGVHGVDSQPCYPGLDPGSHEAGSTFSSPSYCNKNNVGATLVVARDESEEIPACAGMTGGESGMAEEGSGMAMERSGMMGEGSGAMRGMAEENYSKRLAKEGVASQESLVEALNREGGDCDERSRIKSGMTGEGTVMIGEMTSNESLDSAAPQNLVTKAKERLKYDEFLAWQIAMLFVRNKEQKTKPKPKLAKDLAQEFLQNMPFTPTNAQQNAMQEIRDNILSTKSMLRLLQGDVGSGKTLVAIYACLLAISAKKQACVIVPISILADQHFAYFKDLLEGVEIEILTGKTRKKAREKILQRLKDGEIDVLIATHAVLQDDVEFSDLGLAVIDEQHRFGVMQRLKLVEKGKDMDVLLMSATPIPRSLMMGIYGDMDISILDEKPKNRLEIDTAVMSQKKVANVYDGVRRALDRGEKIYWICPLIERKDADLEEIIAKSNDDAELTAKEEAILKLQDLVTAQEKFEELQKVFGKDKVSLIHGKMKESAKEKTMKEFKEGGPGILVATTVIEVGVDVKEATIMVIENAENFGLSQLHQLRGRVGRSDKKSYCILLYGKRYGAIARTRLGIMRESNDGFFIAEEDLKLRGSGEMLGTKQSGDLGFRIANLESDVDLLEVASVNAKVVIEKDPGLEKKESLRYHALLRLFGYGDCLKLVGGG